MVMEGNSGKRDDESVLAMTKCGLGGTMRPATNKSVKGICRSTLETASGLSSLTSCFLDGSFDVEVVDDADAHDAAIGF